MQNVQTLKGFRDFLPNQALKRQYVLNILKKVFESYGFEPLETPALEYEEILTGKYGDEGDKLMYKFEDLGKRKVALRYDQTVPLARVIAKYQNDIPLPFKRYQIQNVWRAENTQRGRYREFLQVDADIVGVYSPLADLEILQLTYDCLNKLGFKFKIKINDRNILKQLPTGIIVALDKLKKIGEEGVLREIQKEGKTEDEAKKILASTKTLEASDVLREIKNLFEKNNPKDILIFEPTLARGLDYYTGIIFEVEVEGYEGGSIAGGGRYDNLIGMFLPRQSEAAAGAGRDIPAVGFSFGFDRLIEAMESLSLFPKNLKGSEVLVSFSDSDLQQKAMEISASLRDKSINSEVYLEDAPLEKQLRYADKKMVPFVLIVNSDGLILKNMSSGEQKETSLENLPNELR